MHKGRLYLIVETLLTPAVMLAPQSLHAIGGSGSFGFAASLAMRWSTPTSASGSSPVAIARVVIQAYFSDAVDGLIEVDIDRMRPKKRQRYLGEKPCEAVA